MFRSENRELPFLISELLRQLQEQIDSKPIFEQKVATSKKLWKNKGGHKHTESFQQLRSILKQMSIAHGICNYCEHNEAFDIEHIAPKSHFPEMTFRWENLLLVCKECNTGYKSDQCKVIDTDGKLRSCQRGTPPPQGVFCFINPRIENPADFMLLNLETFTFEILPDLTPTNLAKAQATLDLLELNSRTVLIYTRKDCSKALYHLMANLVRILNAKSIDELSEILSPHEKKFDFSIPLEVLKAEIKENHKEFIAEMQHPSVWLAIKTVKSRTDPKWMAIFREIPEALDW